MQIHAVENGFEGEGGTDLGQYGHSKDHRPDRKQMVVGAVLDGEGRPLCCELWPGNVTDVKTLIPIVDRLRTRFQIRSICIVADRGMISAATLQALEERKLEYILGARERSTAVIRDVVLADETPFTPLLIARRRGETQLFAKEVKVNGARYIVCRNEAEAEKDRVDRQAIIAGPKMMVEKLRREIYGQRSERKARHLAEMLLSNPCICL